MVDELVSTVRYDVCVQQGFEVWELGSVDVPADVTPAEANQYVIDLLRTVADRLATENVETDDGS